MPRPIVAADPETPGRYPGDPTQVASLPLPETSFTVDPLSASKAYAATGAIAPGTVARTAGAGAAGGAVVTGGCGAGSDGGAVGAGDEVAGGVLADGSGADVADGAGAGSATAAGVAASVETTRAAPTTAVRAKRRRRRRGTVMRDSIGSGAAVFGTRCGARRRRGQAGSCATRPA